MYMALFATSVFILLGFIYWATAGYMANQTDETIQAEIVGLAEQYQRQGLNGLISVLRERVQNDKDGKSIYLFIAGNNIKLAGNLNAWPDDSHAQDGWINFTLSRKGKSDKSHLARARIFIVRGGLKLLVGRDVQDLMVVKSLIERALNWGVGIMLALAVLGGLMVSRSTRKRIEVINQTSQRIMNGNLDLRIPSRGTGDDFDQLVDNLNQMLDKIVQLMDGIRHVSDSIAHDLRTPLTRLRNHLEQTLLIVHESDGRARVAAAVAETDQLLATFNALLRIARLESSGKVLHPVNLNLSALVEDASELYEAVAEDKDQTFNQHIDSDIWIEGDRDLLFQALSNLIDNAIKYTPEAGQVGVRLFVTESSIFLQVCDSGIGIPEEEREKVFQRFYRVAHSRSLPGNGLGLNLVAAVVGMHQGTIAMRDNNPGLCVEIEFPKMDAHMSKLPVKEATLELPPGSSQRLEQDV
jgi:signal transduction histidine kinase